MKKLAKLYITAVLLFAFLFVISNVLCSKIQKKNNVNINILLNRIVEEVQEKYTLQNASDASVSSQSEEVIQKIIDEYMAVNRSAFSDEYGSSAVPNNVEFISTEA